MSLQETPVANRLHIGFFGRCNSGKSTLVNAFTSQNVTIVSPVAGTTTDVVQKNIELSGLGACVLLDTAGFDDNTNQLGAMRIKKTRECADKVDIAVIIFDQEDFSLELKWLEDFKERNIPVVGVVSKMDIRTPSNSFVYQLKEYVEDLLFIDITKKESLTHFHQLLIEKQPHSPALSITRGLVSQGEVVLLVMPQDIQAPKGRLILPQVQTIRELLDTHCIVIATTTEELQQTLSVLKKPPVLIITDSQVFSYVYQYKPKTSRLTSFSVLFAGLKGDLSFYVESAKKLFDLPKDAHILIAELCSHAPLTEDIGRVKIPNLLRQKIGENITIEMVSGADFPEILENYDFIIQCGACMVNRQLVQSRIAKAKAYRVPMSNYGVVLAALNDILEEIAY